MLDAHELLKLRLKKAGGNQEGRMKKDKLNSLLAALQYSEQAETVIKDGNMYRAILNKNKQKMDYDDKNISIPYDAGFKVGDIFHWVEDDSDWIVYLKEGQDAYFTGICRKAIYDVRWKDEFGIIHSQRGTVRGPVETKIKSEMKSGLSFDIPNYSIYMLTPSTEESLKLKRYDKVSVNGKIFQIEVVDSISEPGILEIQMNEDYKHKDDDVDLVKPGDGTCEYIPMDNIKITTSIDDVDEIEIDEFFKLWVEVEKDGSPNAEAIAGATFTVKSGQAAISEDNTLTALGEGEVVITLSLPKLCFTKDYIINVTTAVLPSIEKYHIEGDDLVKSFGENSYSIALYLDGLETQPDTTNGKWVYALDKTLFRVNLENSNSISFKWVVGSQGIINLQYTINDIVVAEKKITVESLI